MSQASEALTEAPSRTASKLAAWLYTRRWPMAAAAAAFFLQLILFAPLIAGYALTEDDFAVEAVSTPIGAPVSPARWVQDGFHGYFVTYGEWADPGTDFWRPLANLLFWLHYQIFGADWGSQLVFGYLTHAVVVGLVAWIALNVLQLPAGLAALATLIAFFNPAFWSSYGFPHQISMMASHPIFQTEILGALLTLIAYLAFLRSQYAWVAVILTAGVCLKETTLTVPISAAALVLLWMQPSGWRGSLRRAALLLLPVAVWLAAWKLVFRHGHSVYVLAAGSGGWAFILQPIRNALLWPTTLYMVSLHQTAQAIAVHHWGSVLEQGAALGINLLWWALVITALTLELRQRIFYPRTGPTARVTALLFAAGNLALVMLLQQSEPRFGYLWLALAPAPLFAVLAELPALQRWRLPVAAALTAGLIAPQLAAAAAIAMRSHTLDEYWSSRAAGSELTSILMKTPGSTTVYLVNDDAVTPVSPKYVSMVSHFRGRLVVLSTLNAVMGCIPDHSTLHPSSPRLVGTGSNLTLQYGAPPQCYRVWWPYYMPMLHDGRVKRGPYLTYDFPHASTGEQRLIGGAKIDHGDGWSIRSTDPACARPGGCEWLSYDPATRSYHVLAPSAQ